jgi:SAM-dependent methyltransferase
MAISQLLADSVFVRLFRGNAGRGELVVSMAGVKLGDRLLVIGLAEPAVLAVLGAKVGITGRACGVDPSNEAVARARKHAEREGVLVEVETTPVDRVAYEPDGFDVVVVRALGGLADRAALRGALVEGGRVLRDGGRCLVLADAGRRSLAARWSGRGAAPVPGSELVQLLAACGYRGARVLAERDGLLFGEGVMRR